MYSGTTQPNLYDFPHKNILCGFPRISIPGGHSSTARWEVLLSLIPLFSEAYKDPIFRLPGTPRFWLEMRAATESKIRTRECSRTLRSRRRYNFAAQERSARETVIQAAEKSVLHLFLGGAAVYRCDKGFILNPVLAAAVSTLRLETTFSSASIPVRHRIGVSHTVTCQG